MSFKGGAAELLVKGFLEESSFLVHRAAAGGMTSYGKGKFFVRQNDLFGCVDLLGIRRGLVFTDETWAVQVTTESGRSKRRRKMEMVEWPISWRISIVSHETMYDPARKRGKLDFLKIQDYTGGKWCNYEFVAIDVKGLEARRKARDKSAKEAKKILKKIAKGGNTPIIPNDMIQ